MKAQLDGDNVIRYNDLTLQADGLEPRNRNVKWEDIRDRKDSARTVVLENAHVVMKIIREQL